MSDDNISEPGPRQQRNWDRQQSPISTSSSNRGDGGHISAINPDVGTAPVRSGVLARASPTENESVCALVASTAGSRYSGSDIMSRFGFRVGDKGLKQSSCTSITAPYSTGSPPGLYHGLGAYDEHNLGGHGLRYMLPSGSSGGNPEDFMPNGFKQEKAPSSDDRAHDDDSSHTNSPPTKRITSLDPLRRSNTGTEAHMEDGIRMYPSPPFGAESKASHPTVEEDETLEGVPPLTTKSLHGQPGRIGGALSHEIPFTCAPKREDDSQSLDRGLRRNLAFSSQGSMGSENDGDFGNVLRSASRQEAMPELLFDHGVRGAEGSQDTQSCLDPLPLGLLFASDVQDFFGLIVRSAYLIKYSGGVLFEDNNGGFFELDQDLGHCRYLARSIDEAVCVLRGSAAGGVWKRRGKAYQNCGVDDYAEYKKFMESGLDQ